MKIGDRELYALELITGGGPKGAKIHNAALDKVGAFAPSLFPGANELFEALFSGPEINKLVYLHELNFYGHFLLAWIMDHGFTHDKDTNAAKRESSLADDEFTTLINGEGEWYLIIARRNGHVVQFRDSKKIMPFKLEAAAQSFCTTYTTVYPRKDLRKPCKRDIEGMRANCLALSEALSVVCQDITGLTVGSEVYKRFIISAAHNFYRIKFPDLTTLPCVGDMSQDAYVRKSYRGGFNYVNPTIAGKTIRGGYTMDRHACYAYVMMNYGLPYLEGHFREGKPEYKSSGIKGKPENTYYFVHVNVMFELKPGKVPTVQVKDSLLYDHRVYLEKSAVYDFEKKVYLDRLRHIELWFTQDDFELFQEHYDIRDIEYIDYIWFYRAPREIFVGFLDHYKRIEEESTGAKRRLAKLFRNNLYGQFGKKQVRNFAQPTEIDKGYVDYEEKEATVRLRGNIATACAIAAIARRIEVETIQANYDKFLYADTDSIHLKGKPKEFVGSVGKEYGQFKIESIWKRAKFLKLKTYIEELDNGSVLVRAAGMSEDQMIDFRNRLQFKDFKVGLSIKGGKTKPVRVPGGVIRRPVDFTIR